MTKTCAIFDIDGTLADVRHRVHHVNKPKDSGKRDWKAFFAAAKDDTTYPNVVKLNHILWAERVHIFIMTGRPDNHRADTEAWLKRHNIIYQELLMRPANDHRPDYVVKEELYKNHPILSHNHVEYVFEDRLLVAEMWRKQGLNVFLCGEDWRTNERTE